jgi:plasmid stability protein
MAQTKRLVRQPSKIEARMGQVLIRNVSEGLIDAYKTKARLNGKSLEQVLRDVLERNAPFTPEERAALARQYVAEFPARAQALTKEEIREGLL